jgi:[acyl-carrier-protein] S-malonyltransferase
LLERDAYSPILRRVLEETGEIASSILAQSIDLVDRVANRREATLDTYAEAIALILGVERAQLQMLEQVHGISCRDAHCFCGYSLGEVSALVEAGTLSFRDALVVPLSLAGDCAQLANDVTLGVMFSRGAEVPHDEIEQFLIEVNRRGRGVIGVSAELSPNSLLLMGQEKSLDEFQHLTKTKLPFRTQVRRNPNRWPPLHTPIVWQRQIPDKASELMHSLDGGQTAPNPPVISLVTGDDGYDASNVRSILRNWTDHRQQLWDVVLELLERDIQTVIHVGPEPNIMPATFKRLSENVESQTRGSIGMRTLSQIVRRPWLSALLPKRAMLLKAIQMKHIVLEDWLLENDPADKSQ